VHPAGINEVSLPETKLSPDVEGKSQKTTVLDQNETVPVP
jgi:hypothetical protein